MPNEGYLEFFVDWLVLKLMKLLFNNLPLGGGVVTKHEHPQEKKQDVLVFNKPVLFSFSVTSSANATPEFEGRGGEELGTELSNTLYKVFNNKHSLDMGSLCISPGEHCWVLYVDVLVSGSLKIRKKAFLI